MTTDTERLTTGYSGRLLIAASVGWLVIQTGKLVISPLLPAIQGDLGVGSSRAGFALTVLWGVYAILQYPSGKFSDNLSRKTLLVGGLSVLVIGFVMVGVAPTYPVFLCSVTILGIGSGLYPTSARALLSDLFVEKRGTAFGLHTASGDLGGVVAAVFATLVLSVSVWRTAFFPLALVVILVGTGLHLWSQEEYVVSNPALNIRPTFRRLLGYSKNRWLLVAYVLYAFTWQASTGFLPTYLQNGKQFSPLVANVAFAMLFGVGVFAKPFAGLVGDKFSRVRVVVTALSLAAISLVGIVVSDSLVAVMIGVTMFAVGLLSFPPVMQAFLMDSFPEDSYGGDLGAMRTIYIGLGAFGPTYVGVIASIANYDLAFFGLSVALMIAGFLVETTASDFDGVRL